MISDNNVYLSCDLIVEYSLFCSGKILFEDISDRIEQAEYDKIETGTSSLNYNSSGNMTASGSLFIDGNIVLNENIYHKEDIYEVIRIVSSDEINPKTFTIKCVNFIVGKNFKSEDNYIHTTNHELLLKLRQMKIKKIKND